MRKWSATTAVLFSLAAAIPPYTPIEFEAALILAAVIFALIAIWGEE